MTNTNAPANPEPITRDPPPKWFLPADLIGVTIVVWLLVWAIAMPSVGDRVMGRGMGGFWGTYWPLAALPVLAGVAASVASMWRRPPLFLVGLRWAVLGAIGTLLCIQCARVNPKEYAAAKKKAIAWTEAADRKREDLEAEPRKKVEALGKDIADLRQRLLASSNDADRTMGARLDGMQAEMKATCERLFREWRAEWEKGYKANLDRESENIAQDINNQAAAGPDGSGAAGGVAGSVPESPSDPDQPTIPPSSIPDPGNGPTVDPAFVFAVVASLIWLGVPPQLVLAMLPSLLNMSPAEGKVVRDFITATAPGAPGAPTIPWPEWPVPPNLPGGVADQWRRATELANVARSSGVSLPSLMDGLGLGPSAIDEAQTAIRGWGQRTGPELQQAVEQFVNTWLQNHTQDPHARAALLALLERSVRVSVTEPVRRDRILTVVAEVVR